MKNSIRTSASMWLSLLGVVLGCLPASLANAQQWGNVKGRVVFSGSQIPAPVMLNVSQDQKVCLAKGPIESEELIINKTNFGVKNTFVWLIPAVLQNPEPLAIHPNLQAIPKKNVEVDQPCCMFVPHALAMREGQVLVAKNSSTIAHNFNWTGHPLKNPGGNSIIPAGNELKVAGLVSDRLGVKMACNIHPWMSGYIKIFTHPYYALTDADGKFEIKDAPVGPCRMVTWQESVGWVDGGKDGQLINIPAGKTLDVGEIKMPK